jgi:hypothetical protein
VLSGLVALLAASRWRAAIRIPDALSVTRRVHMTTLARAMLFAAERDPDGRPLH